MSRFSKHLETLPEVLLLPRAHAPYTPDFHCQMVDLVRAKRNSDELAREFELTAQSIRTWVAQADRQKGQRE